MSLGFAEKLSYREDFGTVGMSEIFDPPDVLQHKIHQLAMMIKKSRHLVAFTGAGISTSCGIPDFRGPKGVWTQQREGKGVPEALVPFHRTVPSMTHMALVALEKAGILKFVISQNVDSLHLRSGIKREKLSELHGNSFKEICPMCGVEYLRDFEVETIGMKRTPRHCSNTRCGARLKDTILDWEDVLPKKEMIQAEQHCQMADVVLCLGSSLQITPACNLPLQSLAHGGKIVIVNLQETPKDNKASLVIHGLVDKVVAGVMLQLNLQVPPYVHVDLFQIKISHCSKYSDKKYVRWTLSIGSMHGQRAPLLFILSVEVSFPERPDLKAVTLDKQPFKLTRETLEARPLKISLKPHFGNGCGCQCASVVFEANFKEPANTINHDKDAVIKKLKELAVEEQCCGQTSLVQRDHLPSSKKEIIIYATATNFVEYSNIVPSVQPSEDIPKSKDYLIKDFGAKRQKNLSFTNNPRKKLKSC